MPRPRFARTGRGFLCRNLLDQLDKLVTPCTVCGMSSRGQQRPHPVVGVLLAGYLLVMLYAALGGAALFLAVALVLMILACRRVARYRARR